MDREPLCFSLEYTWVVDGGHVFTHVMWDMYWAPPGFCFDTTCTDPPMVRRLGTPEHNAEARAGALVQYLEQQVICGGVGMRDMLINLHL